ncbi:MAG: GNAT family N-acetyltransferase [Lactobacillus sp.]|jgi:GNAT superfamily N-acetyltransferase|nr:GNAT family N-acetyltransferase [Lactobacillus sp.]
MKLELFTNQNELEEYLKVAVLSMPSVAAQNIIPDSFRKEICEGLKFTQSLSSDFRADVGPWILYALRNDANEIIGALMFSKDRHIKSAAQLEYLGIREDQQKKGYGTLIIKEIIKEVKKHSDYKFATFSTSPRMTEYYEKLGFKCAGTAEFPHSTRCFFYKEI